MNSTYARWAARWRVPMGFVFVVAYVFLCRPTPKLLVVGGIVAAAGVAMRAYAAGHLVKNRKLARNGPYAWTRNPLYFGSSLMAAGFAIASGNWILAAACLLLFAGIYWPVIRREEDYLRGEFGQEYAVYAGQVPLFFPRFRRPANSAPFDWKQYRKNHEYEALLGYLGLMIFLAIRIWLR